MCLVSRSIRARQTTPCGHSPANVASTISVRQPHAEAVRVRASRQLHAFGKASRCYPLTTGGDEHISGDASYVLFALLLADGAEVLVCAGGDCYCPILVDCSGLGRHRFGKTFPLAQPPDFPERFCISRVEVAKRLLNWMVSAFFVMETIGFSRHGRASAAPSSSRDVVPVGPQQVQIKHGRPRRNSIGHLPSTSRALTLCGKQELQANGKPAFISGPDKLMVLGNDLETRVKSQQTIMNPFNLEQAIRIADSQSNHYVDDILALKTSDHFFSSIAAEIYARLPSNQSNSSALKDRARVADALMSRVHNSYMLASCWKIIRNHLEMLEHDGLADANIRDQLVTNDEMRTGYLTVYDIVAELGDVLQNQHFSPYFKSVLDAEDPSAAFNWENLKGVYKSYVDSIVIELCLPGSHYPRPVLVAILSEALEESPRDERHFPQALFNALGDLSNAVKLLDILDAPLLALREVGTQFKSQPREMPDEYAAWVDAQVDSEHVLNITLNNDLDIIFPLEKAKKHSVVDNLWRRIDNHCKDVADETFWALWMLEDASRRLPYWGVSPSAIDKSKALVLGSKKQPNKSVRKLLTNGYDSDGSHGSMPSLETASDSFEDEDDQSEEWSDADEEDDNDSDDESAYDSDADEEMRHLFREAMDSAFVNPEYLDHTKKGESFLTDEDRKDNTFIKLLGALRVYQSTASRQAKHTLPSAAKVEIQPSTPRPGKVTAEEVEDEGEAGETKKKKKKKKPKKKKPAAASISPETIPGPPLTTPTVPSPMSLRATATSSNTAVAPSKIPAASPAKKLDSTAINVTLTNASRTSLSSSASESTTYLPMPQTARSARSYLQEEGPKEKTKTKSRMQPGLEPVQEKLKESRFARFLSKFSKHSKQKEEVAQERDDLGGAFAGLSKKASACMSQILQTKETTRHPPMKWEHFVKACECPLSVMREMGFDVDLSTAGSSVRFDPPGKNTRSITFHKRSHIEPVTLMQWGKRLKECYGWEEEIYMKYRKA
ncbi:hypothetical protein K488DRAFT_74250 [Vararia minispora EC-137]|uniref:Uncharacterized protein n=1 Tax=Vararia minispora EC-137 TaxID=1314806 RepID=A0ACB8Q7Y3_9AGAM|nr:hypothetical protein K488DRAFT_74250 [Vararia minispora EC-137]